MNVKETLASYKIPKRSVSDLCDIHSSELSAYLRRRENVSAAKALRIEKAVADITFTLDRLASTELPFSLNLRDIPALKKMIEFCKATSEEVAQPIGLPAKHCAKQLLKQLLKQLSCSTPGQPLTHEK